MRKVEREGGRLWRERSQVPQEYGPGGRRQQSSRGSSDKPCNPRSGAASGAFNEDRCDFLAISSQTPLEKSLLYGAASLTKLNNRRGDGSIPISGPILRC
jgi:hypothetical protein